MLRVLGFMDELSTSKWVQKVAPPGKRAVMAGLRVDRGGKRALGIFMSRLGIGYELVAVLEDNGMRAVASIGEPLVWLRTTMRSAVLKTCPGGANEHSLEADGDPYPAVAAISPDFDSALIAFGFVTEGGANHGGDICLAVVRLNGLSELLKHESARPVPETVAVIPYGLAEMALTALEDSRGEQYVVAPRARFATIASARVPIGTGVVKADARDVIALTVDIAGTERGVWRVEEVYEMESVKTDWKPEVVRNEGALDWKSEERYRPLEASTMYPLFGTRRGIAFDGKLFIHNCRLVLRRNDTCLADFFVELDEQLERVLSAALAYPVMMESSSDLTRWVVRLDIESSGIYASVYSERRDRSYEDSRVASWAPLRF